VKEPLIATTSAIAGYTVAANLGMARGSTVRAKHIGRDITALLKNIVGGEIKGYTELLAEGREEALYRMIQDAQRLGADGVIGVRMTTSMISQGAVEIMAYGTAVKLEECNS